jgi:8-oxo-dGTP diphosphatase
MVLEDYARPSVTIDTVIFTVKDGDLKILLVRKGINPFKGKWAIPGGFIKMDESLDDAARRELEEETGVKDVYLEQLYTFGDVGRDPRGRVLTVAYMALINSEEIKLRASTDTIDVKWFGIKNLPELCFDHKNILEYALKRLKWKFEYTPVGFSLLSEKFKLSELLRLYEIVFDKVFDKRNFNKKIHSLNILKEVGLETGTPFRPARLYSLKKNISEVLGII